MANYFENAEYSYGTYGFMKDIATSTGYGVNRGVLNNRAATVTAIACTPGKLVAKNGYKVNANPLTSNKTEPIEVSGSIKDVYVDVIYKDTSFYQWEDTKILPKGTTYCCVSVKKDDGSDFTQSEIDNIYGTAFEYIQDEVLGDNATYDIHGNIIVKQGRKYVQIEALKQQYPTYDDDQLLDKAIGLARASGDSTKILWDGTYIHFAGSIEHQCYGFGGIDFNGSKIYMPDYDTDLSKDYPPVIIKVLPDIYQNVSATASDFTKYRTTKSELKNKVFTINSNYAGNADMCLGSRGGFDTTIYYTPTMITMPDGEFYTSHLYLVPSSGDVTCYNVHDYPAVTFEISNGIVMTRDSQKMSCLVQCFRSNTHLHNFTLYGSKQSVTSLHSRYLFSFERCADIEVDHIAGLNPVPANNGGYVLEMASITNAYIHDCHIGDETTWGVMGCNHLTNGFFERCDMNRWDSHYAQYGTQTIKECNLSWVGYGVGYGTFVIDNCTFIAKPNENIQALITMRTDTVGVYDGNMIAKNCRFLARENDPSKIIVWGDGGTDTKPSNSKVTGSPEKNRILENCEFPNGCYAIFRVGLSAQADKPMYQNLSYKVKDSVINCSEGVFIPFVSGQAIKEVILDGCTVGNCPTVKNLTDCDVKISNCELVAVVSNNTLPRLSATGCTFSGSQSVDSFTNYALAGNIASDMASVNKHS